MSKSSVLDLIDYRQIGNGLTILDITFKTGQVYRYYGVPNDVFNNFINADSKGSFFSEKIRTNYRFELIKK